MGGRVAPEPLPSNVSQMWERLHREFGFHWDFMFGKHLFLRAGLSTLLVLRI